MKNASLLLLSIIIASAVLASCHEISKGTALPTAASTPKQEMPSSNGLPSSHGIAAGSLEGKIKIEAAGSSVKATYTFHNQTERRLHIVGGAKYTLWKDDALVEKGAVPIKDYIDLAQGEAYTDAKTFKNLKSGTYSLRVEWSDAAAAATFTLK